MIQIKYPKDLASIVSNELRRKGDSKLSDSVLTSVFETMYFSSIQTEEAQSIVFNVVYLDHDKHDKPSTISILNRGWSAVEFTPKIPFNVSNVLKLAKASDPRTSSLAIFHNDEEIYIWGLIDQDNGFYDFLNYESEERPSRPGLFQASLEGPGNIVVYVQYTKIAELIVNRIVRRTV